MEFKFIVVALVVTIASGEQASRNLESPTLETVVKTLGSVKNEELHQADHGIETQTEKITHAINYQPVSAPNNGLLNKIMKSDISSTITDDGSISNKTTDGTNTTTSTTSTTTSTTTTSTTTTSTTTSTTSTTPSTTTSTTTFPPPTAKPAPEEGKWKVINQSNFVCIALQMEIEFNITYPGNNTKMYNTTVYVPKSAVASGNCGNVTQNITLKWDSGNSFNIDFALNKTTEKFEINSFDLFINTTNFENIKDGVKNLTYSEAKPKFPAIPVKMSYKCDKQVKHILQSPEKFNATLFISHTQFEAFIANNNTQFGEVKDCEGFDTPDIVPIAVGCVLSILVVIVLLAYLIGRRRSQNRGYLSM